MKWKGLFLLAGALLLGPGSHAAEPAAGRIKAWTQGVFSIRYRLVPARNIVRVRSVQVSVKNALHFRAKPTRLLREHEAVHRRINEAEALRIQKEMEAFEWAGENVKDAESAFRERFFQRIQAVRDLHRAWDSNHPIL